MELWRGKIPGRDADFEKAVRERLERLLPDHVANSAETVTQLLKSAAKVVPPALSVEQLLTAVLQSQSGFGAMLRAILDTLVHANATRSENYLLIQIPNEVGEGNGKLFDQFREYVEKVERILKHSLEPISGGFMRDIENALERIQGIGYVPRASMVEARERIEWESPPEPLATGSAAVNSYLRVMLDVMAVLRAWASNVIPRRVELHLYEIEDTERERMGLLSNFVDCHIVDLVHVTAQRVRDGQLGTREVIDKLAPLIATLPRRAEWADQVVRSLSELFKLPIWKRRFELYSVWLGTVLLRTASQRASSFQYRAINNVLSFDFGGSCLAAYEFDGASYEIWSEIRSSLVGSSSIRTKGIQPDFRVVRVSDSDDQNSYTRFIVESKHYLQASASNFIAAANDYARSCTSSHVAVVNHGIGDPVELSKGIETGNLGRVTFFEKVSVDTDRGAALSKKITEVLFPTAVVGNSVLETRLGAIRFDAARHVACVAVSWYFPLKDVDLSIHGLDEGFRSHRISYLDKGRLDDFPFSELREDCTESPGDEVIDISKWHLSSYEIEIDNYSRVGCISDETCLCSITVNDETSIVVPTCAVGETWVVGTIDFVRGIPILSLASGSILVA